MTTPSPSHKAGRPNAPLPTAAAAAAVSPDLARYLRPAAVVYARQSKTDADQIDEGGQSLSSSNQIHKGAQYCQIHDFDIDMDMSRACVDLDTSGGAKVKDRRRGVRSWQKRPGLMRLYDAAQQGKFQHLICYDLNRLGGDDTELHLIKEAFGDLGITIHIIKYGIRTDTDAGHMLFGVFAQFARQRLKDISETLRDNARERVTGQKRHHGRPPHWIEILPSYASTPEELAIEVAARGPRGTAGWYRLHPIIAPVLRELVMHRLQGCSYSEIARRLNDPDQDANGVRPTPNAVLHTSNGQRGLWTAGLVYEYLTEDVRLKYRGCSVYGRRLKEGNPLRVVTANILPPLFRYEVQPGIVVDTTAETLAALDAIQDAYRAKSFDPAIRPRSSNPPPDAPTVAAAATAPRPARVVAKTEFLCSSLVYCGICGGRLTSGYSGAPRPEDGKRYRQYICKAAPAVSSVLPHPNKHKKTDAKGMSVGSNRVETSVLHALAQLARRLRDLGWQNLPAPPEPKRSSTRRAPGAPKRSVEAVTAEIDLLVSLLAAGRIKPGDYDRRYDVLCEERTRIEEWLSTRQNADQRRAGYTALLAHFAPDAETETNPVTSSSGATPAPDPDTVKVLRVILLQLVERIVCPVIIPGHRRKPASREEEEHVRLVLKAPLPDGTVSVLSAMYKHNYAGPRRVLLEGPSEAVSEPVSGLAA